MKFKPICFLLLTGMALVFTQCTKSEMENSGKKSSTLHSCTEKKLGEPYICFDSLITDSRCPIGAVCFWQGTALIKIRFFETSNVHSFIMSLKGFPALGYPNDTTVNSYRIVFNDLKPYTSVNNPAPKETEEVATFDISH